ncbi:DNA-processing protein DprA [Solibacillus sp. FSL H8-0538]|uniref:DNA-processing protein DprA n=1 Tax=Solibacillus sp. FSL H8-0538 TaxID=2921400 RepID=UPI0030FD01F9
MTNQIDLHKLLTLHYVYPLPFHKFQRLQQYISTLDQLAEFPSPQLATILNLTVANARALKEHYLRMLEVPLAEHYALEGISPVPFTSEFYPKKLLQLIDPPTVLYAKGDISLLQKPKKIAVIGSRQATNYTAEALQLLLPPLIEHDYVIVSGLAKGADSLAHKAAIFYGGKTIGILGHGFFHLYPKENKQLAEEMAQHHLLLTEYPPYVSVKKWHFPMRNRIISGISDALVVTEAALKSGTLITTEHALDHGKDVFVVPGPITSEQSKGTNKILKEGAIPVWNGYQIIDEMQMFSSFS